MPGHGVGKQIRAKLLWSPAARMRAQREDAEHRLEWLCSKGEVIGLSCLSSPLIAAGKKLRDPYCRYL